MIDLTKNSKNLLNAITSKVIKTGKIGWIYFGENTGPVIARKYKLIIEKITAVLK